MNANTDLRFRWLATAAAHTETFASVIGVLLILTAVAGIIIAGPIALWQAMFAAAVAVPVALRMLTIGFERLADAASPLATVMEVA